MVLWWIVHLVGPWFPSASVIVLSEINLIESFIYEVERRSWKKKQTKNNWKEGICKTFISFKFRFISISFYDFSIFQTIWYKNELMYLYLATMPLSIGLVFFLKESLWITCKQLKKCHERFTGIVCLFPRILRFLWCSQLTRVRL